MSKQSIRKPLAVALSTAVVATMGVAGTANAEEADGLFAMEDLMSGQLMAAAHEEGDSGKDKGKGKDKKDGEGSCGEGKCGGDKKGKKGKKDGEGSCGEGKCGG